MSTRQTFELTLHGLRVRKASLLGWSVALGLTMIAFIAMYPSIAKMDFEKIAAQYPEGLLKAFGIESVAQLSTASGFLNMELFGVILPLALVFLPIGLVAHAISGAEERRYMVPLLALPLARTSVMLAAAISALVAQLLAIVVIVASSLLGSVLVGAGLQASEISESALATLPLGLLAAGVAALTAGLTARRGAATAIAGMTIVGMYLVQVLASFSNFFSDLAHLSVFHYYSAWINSGIEWGAYAAICVASIVLVAGACWCFARRDIG